MIRLLTYLNRGMNISLKQLVRNILISIFVFMPLPYNYYLYGHKYILILFIISLLLFIIMLNLLKKWYYIILIPSLFIFVMIMPYLEIILIFIYVLLFFIILNLLKKWYYIIAIPSLLFSAMITPYLVITRSKISYNAIGSIYDTDYQEATEFISSQFSLKYIIIFIVILLIPFLINYMNFISSKIYIRIKPISLLALLLLSLYGFDYRLKQKQGSRQAVGVGKYYPMREIVLMKKFFYDNKYFVYEYKNTKFNSRITEDRDNNISIILVIGEADRKSSWGIYGNPYNTTPYLSNLVKNKSNRIVFFSDMLTAAAFTRVAVPSLLSVSNAINYDKIPVTPSVYKILKKTSINTVFITRRNINSFQNNLVTIIMRDNKVFEAVNDKYDGDLLPLVYKQLNKNEKNLITVHLSGSHYKYDTRYPKEHTCFEPKKPESNYLSSVRYTNFVLSKIIEKMKTLNRPYVLIYLPDHGEYVNDNGDHLYGHGFKALTRNEIEIPLVFIFNDKFIKEKMDLIKQVDQYKHKKISLDNISHSLLGILGVEDLSYDNTYDLSSKKFIEHPRIIIDRNLNIHDANKINFISSSNNEKGIKDICKENTFKH